MQSSGQIEGERSVTERKRMSNGTVARLGGDSDLDIHTRFDGDLGDSLDDLGWSLQVDVSLVDSHLVGVPGLRTLTVRSLSGGDLQDLGWDSDWALLDQLVVLGVLDDVGRDVLQLLDLGGGQSDSDLVDLRLFLLLTLFLLEVRHC